MKIVEAWPPNIEQIKKIFDLTGKEPAFAYGDILYSPYGNKIVDHLWVHEKTHQKQQGEDPAGWWNKYLIDPQFRLSQELEAYRNQFSFYKSKNPAWMTFLRKIAGDLSGPMYGNLLSLNEAIGLIMSDKKI